MRPQAGLPLSLLLPLPLVLGLAVACSTGGPDVETSDVAGPVPWTQAERHSYVLLDTEGEELGRGVLSVEIDNGTTTLTESWESPAGSDETSVVVDSETLKPVSVLREIVAPSGTEVLEVTYTEEGALIRHGDRQSGLTVPDHAYDNHSSLFLWRTLPFAEGYEASYVTLITNQRESLTVSLRVTGRETVSVPAGDFDTWRLEVRAGGLTQVAWFADDPGRALVRYDNDAGFIYELESLSAPSAAAGR